MANSKPTHAPAKRKRHRLYKTPTYHSWASMKSRCDNPSNPKYKNYGGRGIRYCEQWASFDGFFSDMGERPAGMTLDRIDPHGNYEQSNCRWASPKAQSRNMTCNHRHFVGGEMLTTGEMAERSGIPEKTIWSRIFKGGESPVKAMSRPPLPRKRMMAVVGGVEMSLRAAAAIKGIKYDTARRRILIEGMSVEDALTAPLRK